MAKIIVEPNRETVIKTLTNLIAESANKVIETGEIFKIGLSGGSLINFLAEGLPTINTDWSKWRFFFCDERIVAFDSQESTFGQYKANLLSKIDISEDQFITVDPNLSVDEAAKDYIKKMSVYFPPDSLPRFDMLLLGMGPDGHTCSLFPGHRKLEDASRWVISINDSPKPPPSRITLTFSVINNAQTCVFALTGREKAEMVKKILCLHEDVPARRVQPTNGDLYWILDEAAAADLNKDA